MVGGTDSSKKTPLPLFPLLSQDEADTLFDGGFAGEVKPLLAALRGKAGPADVVLVAATAPASRVPLRSHGGPADARVAYTACAGSS